MTSFSVSWTSSEKRARPIKSSDRYQGGRFIYTRTILTIRLSTSLYDSNDCNKVKSYNGAPQLLAAVDQALMYGVTVKRQILQSAWSSYEVRVNCSRNK